ncbi:hypothetical protein ANCCEY_00920 [Ancylostoma ceylanicum]|uniref:Uncharacterized protein n=1 Tax=Ancylostoma ceylanicum TaxID=53326 RepID=A0A0D6MB22_9BILA|nr:hypothetical protein ANCCEY_00920 [Ancylostoma ceylanicum]
MFQFMILVELTRLKHFFDNALHSIPVEPHYKFYIRTPESVLKENSGRVIDELCSEKFGTCFEIKDELTANELTFENVDTRTWPVDKTWVHLYYARLMITGAYFSGALELGSTATQKVLILGLGGGVINNFFSDAIDKGNIHVTSIDNDPVMVKIAKKWYDLIESPSHRVIIDDAVQFVSKEVAAGKKYDVILVDVCYNKVRQLMCPIDELLNDTVISDMNKIVKSDGAVIVNVVTNDGTISPFDHDIYLKELTLKKVNIPQIELIYGGN